MGKGGREDVFLTQRREDRKGDEGERGGGGYDFFRADGITPGARGAVHGFR